MLKLKIAISEVAVPKAVGMIRHGSALIRIYSKKPINKEDLRATASWLQTTDTTRPEHRTVPWRVCDSAIHWDKTLKIVCSEELYFTDICVDTVDLKGASSLQVGNAKLDELAWLDPRLSLERIQTLDFESFYSFFTFKTKRHFDIDTVFYVSRSNLLATQVAPEIYVNSAVIFCYKALELKGKDIEDAETFLLEAFKKTDNFSVLTGTDSDATGIRSDPIAGKLSIYTALLHLYLYQREFNKINDIVGAVETLIDASPFDDAYAYNVSRIFMAGGIVSAIQGNHKLTKHRLNSVVDIFYRAVSIRIPNRQVYRFAELAASHSLATYAMRLLNLTPPYPSVMLVKALPIISRITSEDYMNTISRHFEISI